MNLIHTTALTGENPFVEYPTTVTAHAQYVPGDPSRWMPWSYKAALAEEVGAPTDA